MPIYRHIILLVTRSPFVIAQVAHPPLLRQSGGVRSEHTMVDMEHQELDNNGMDDNPDRLQWLALLMRGRVAVKEGSEWL